MTEKISVTLNLTELGQIDYLVEKGLYNNRSDFMRLAARKMLEGHESEFGQFLMEGRNRANNAITKSNSMIGAFVLEKSDISRILEDGRKIHLRVIGVMKISKKITADDIKQAYASIRITGKLFASDEVREAIENL